MTKKLESETEMDSFLPLDVPERPMMVVAWANERAREPVRKKGQLFVIITENVL